TFFLTNADAKAVVATLKGILKTRDVVADEKLNLVIMRDSAEVVAQAEKLVALQDMPEPEVMLEVEILEIKRTRLLELGIRWPSSLKLTPLIPETLEAGNLTLDELRRQSSRTIGAEIGPVTINARKDDTDVNLLANPRIRARNHEKAKIFIGERVPNITTTATATGFVSESINYVDVGLTLNVEPTVYLDDDVAIKIGLEVNNIVSRLPTPSGSVAYQIGTRTASTVLRLKNGETQVLAGLINDEDRRSGNKIPLAGELPVVGRLFGSGSSDSTKTEIVLSITPRLIRNIERPSARMTEFRSGTDAGFRTRGEAIPVRETQAGPGSVNPLAPPNVNSPLPPQPRGPSPSPFGVTPSSPVPVPPVPGTAQLPVTVTVSPAAPELPVPTREAPPQQLPSDLPAGAPLPASTTVK
ncbi:MAG TPA: secretin N-terminal domain-containing protein, partial [Burkholderiaceae bacterium]